MKKRGTIQVPLFFIVRTHFLLAIELMFVVLVIGGIFWLRSSTENTSGLSGKENQHSYSSLAAAIGEVGVKEEKDFLLHEISEERVKKEERSEPKRNAEEPKNLPPQLIAEEQQHVPAELEEKEKEGAESNIQAEPEFNTKEHNETVWKVARITTEQQQKEQPKGIVPKEKEVQKEAPVSNIEKSVNDRAASVSPIININTASSAELEQLEGIGPALAGRIVQYRSEHGTFYDISDITHVKGIGEAKFAAIKDKITVGNVKREELREEEQPVEAKENAVREEHGPGCLLGQTNINSASLEELTSIIHIGVSRAEALMVLRPFSSLEELTRVKGIGPSRLEDIKLEGVACVE